MTEDDQKLVRDVRRRHPPNRAACKDGTRPCPHVSCLYHLQLHVHENPPKIENRFPGSVFWEVPFSCGLDVADLGSRDPKEVAEILGYEPDDLLELERQVAKKLRRHLES